MFGLSLSKKIKLLTVYVVDIALLCVALVVACCYRCSVVCLSVGYNCELSKPSTDQDAIWMIWM